MNTVRRPVAEPGASGHAGWRRHLEHCAAPLSSIQRASQLTFRIGVIWREIIQRKGHVKWTRTHSRQKSLASARSA